MRKLLTLAVTGVLAISLMGCSSSSSGATEADDSAQTSQEEAVDLDNLSIGDTAVFKNYSITVSNVQIDGNVTNVDVTMDAKSKSTFASRYMDAITSSGKKVSADSLADMTVDAGDTYRTLLTFKSIDINTLVWDNWNNEAEWHFILDTPEIVEDESSSYTDVHDQVFYGWEAVRAYGEHAYPYGFKLHSFLDAQVEENLYGDTWHLVAGCEIKNEYGKWAKNLVCNAVVTGSGEDWTVDSFVIE